ncbi:MAG: hypothetical protein AAF196_05675 [Planctomycetota bacterium]
MTGAPHAVLYRFIVRAGSEESFVAAWSGLTKLIHERAGSHGSCLHRVGDREYLAYARWPSAAHFDAVSLEGADAEALRTGMRASCEEVETVHRMDVVQDLLATP